MTKTPIIILSKERPMLLADMIESIEKYTLPGTYEIIICDNDSKQVEMIAYLHSLKDKYTVIKNESNLHFEGLNPGLEIVKRIGCKYFIISDPDIVLLSDIPSNWIELLIRIAEETDYPKIGLALSLEFGRDSKYIQSIKDREAVNWSRPVPIPSVDAPCYEAMIDTTMCLYRRDTYDYWDENTLLFDRNHGITKDGWINNDNPHYNKKYKSISLRVAGAFTASHIGWYVDPKYVEDVKYYYIALRNSPVSSTLAWGKLDDMIDDGILPIRDWLFDPRWKTPSIRNKFLLKSIGLTQ